MNQFSLWKQLMWRRASPTSLSVFRNKCNSSIIQEKTFQFSKGWKQSHPATNHLLERIEDRPSTTATWTPKKNHRTWNASWFWRSMIHQLIILLFLINFEGKVEYFSIKNEKNLTFRFKPSSINWCQKLSRIHLIY